MTKLSVLDLAPVTEGNTPRDALHNSLDLAQHAERWGYERYWLAEHHNMKGIASAATSVVIGYIAGGTSTIRVGAGGIMLPNHSPLVIAEQFGTLASLYPGRVDLGLGRAPGTDPITSRALRRTLNGSADDFPRDVVELQHYFKESEPGQRVTAVPGAGTNVPLWILGSSLFGAQLAAMLGLPYAFASHFAPAQMTQAIAVYRERFEPSEQLQAPYVMLGFNVCAAETDHEAHYLRSSSLQSFISLRRGTPGQLPPPIKDFEESMTAQDRALLAQISSCSAVGSLETVTDGLAKFIERTGADELMLVSSIFDHQKRLRSFEMAAEAGRQLAG
ncbi:MAG: LLM class flavin-dependent oxidoreductase [Deltaproteobacteria bacterium]|nr:LLM class flavin-dependent oxidoreductase [Deltaproteobacteria bacterium]MBW2293254.1 LLM class flavin-dependent oxidoreductase [Deltaproteobacteria bacterium]MBW2387709.1 LLM class flavin-dependent oxidoreductase [Deltaproteobacteria bacterium]